jgi:hypothetical protein
MTYLCTETCFSGRLYESGESYDSIGTASPRFFQEIGAPEPDEAEVEVDERAEIKAKLDLLGVEYNPRLGLNKLKSLLQEQQLVSAFDA